jgi:hypothetical protein
VKTVTQISSCAQPFMAIFTPEVDVASSSVQHVRFKENNPGGAILCKNAQ